MTYHNTDLKHLHPSDDELTAAVCGSFIVGFGCAVLLLITLSMGG